MEKINTERSYISKKTTLNQTSTNLITSILPPPNPLIQRKNIPLNSPKFGKSFQYVKLISFCKEERKNELIGTTESNQIKENDENFEKNCDLNFYINNQNTLETDLNKESKINMENIVNLKKKNSEIPKKKIVKPFFTPTDSKDTTLIFESRFESGNLLASFKISENNYHLIVQNDTNTNGYSQWFFFKVSNVKKGTNARFNILNLMKPYSLYNKGMKVVLYSEKKAALEKIGWHRGGVNIKYYRNLLYKFVRDRKKLLSSLCFNYEFEYDDDNVFFAYSQPYTYSEIMHELNDIQKQDKKFDYIHRKSLCSTLAGNNLDYFTIATQVDNPSSTNENRQGIVIMARVHPGETVSSWMMKGVFNFLLGDSYEANFLRRNFIIKIIPMMNPDGVINGNYRTSLAGCDLNRRWEYPNEILHPEIFYAKQMILKFASHRNISFICDLHGHSGAHNIFMYGNKIDEDPSVSKVFPYLLSKISPVFNFSQCSFKMPKCKLGTARINLFNELNNMPNIFTMEASFCGSNRGLYTNIHFDSSILMDMGRDLCRAFVSYSHSYDTNYKYDLNFTYNNNSSFLNFNDFSTDTSDNQNDINKISNKKFILIDKNSLLNDLNLELEDMEKNKKNKIELNCSDDDINVKDNIESDNGSAGSDSEPSIDNFENELLVKLMPVFAKKKKKKIKKSKAPIFPKKSLAKTPSSEIRPSNAVVKPNPPSDKIETKPKKEKITEKYPPVIAKESPEKVILEKKETPHIFRPIVIEMQDNQPQPIQKNKKDAETQTEEIFFKMNYSFFQNKGFTVRSATKSNRVLNSIQNKNYSISVNNNRSYSIESINKKRYSFYQDISKNEKVLGILKKNQRDDNQNNNDYNNNSNNSIQNNNVNLVFKTTRGVKNSMGNLHSFSKINNDSIDISNNVSNNIINNTSNIVSSNVLNNVSNNINKMSNMNNLNNSNMININNISNNLNNNLNILNNITNTNSIKSTKFKKDYSPDKALNPINVKNSSQLPSNLLPPTINNNEQQRIQLSKYIFEKEEQKFYFSKK